MVDNFRVARPGAQGNRAVRATALVLEAAAFAFVAVRGAAKLAWRLRENGVSTLQVVHVAAFGYGAQRLLAEK